MNGGMNYPSAYAKQSGLLERVFVRTARELSHYVNVLIPGKRHAAALLVANQRTNDALPRTVAQRVISLVENGVDLSLFTRPKGTTMKARDGVRFAFMGRLIELKCVDILIDAIAKCPPSYELVVLGEGPMRPSLEAQVAQLGLQERVLFRGQLTQKECRDTLAECDALVLPSVRECGGAVVLEAMAMGLPVVATNWGGPQDYLDADTGILVEPRERPRFTEGLYEALVQLGESPQLRSTLGAAGRERVEREFDWERKIDRILEIYRDVANLPRVAPRPISRSVALRDDLVASDL
jgi:glycosyltransferase involved in cell wall biosynthesis